jgi:predicted nucleic acid-binding Zn ribbon protein
MIDVEERRRSRPSPVGPMLEDLFERLGILERVEKAKTASRWNEIVGPHIGRVTSVGGVRGGTLFIEVAGAAWMTELNMMRRTLLRRLNEDRDRGQIERIMFVQAEEASAASEGRVRHSRRRG